MNLNDPTIYKFPCEGDKCMNNPCCEDGLNSTKEAVVEPYAEIEDLRGRPVRVGDRIAYAATDGRSAGLRVGTVIEIVRAHEKEESYGYTRKVPTKLRVSVDVSSGYWAPEKPTLIEVSFKRFVKLD